MALLRHPENNISVEFSATLSDPDYSIDDLSELLRVRARNVDRIKACGPPYYASLCKRLSISEHIIFNVWFEMCQDERYNG